MQTATWASASVKLPGMGFEPRLESFLGSDTVWLGSWAVWTAVRLGKSANAGRVVGKQNFCQVRVSKLPFFARRNSGVMAINAFLNSAFRQGWQAPLVMPISVTFDCPLLYAKVDAGSAGLPARRSLILLKTPRL